MSNLDNRTARNRNAKVPNKKPVSKVGKFHCPAMRAQYLLGGRECVSVNCRDDVGKENFGSEGVAVVNDGLVIIPVPYVHCQVKGQSNQVKLTKSTASQLRGRGRGDVVI